MPKVRGNPGNKWTRRAAVATEDYKSGINAPREQWQTATLAAADVHKTATQAALNRGAFSAGVRMAGNEKWQRKAAGIGADRYAQGVAAAESDYEKGVAPYLDVIENTKLPPRGAKGDPSNLQRVK